MVGIKNRSYKNCTIAKQVFQWSIELSENGTVLRIGLGRLKKLLMYVRMPDLCNMVQPGLLI